MRSPPSASQEGGRNERLLHLQLQSSTATGLSPRCWWFWSEVTHGGCELRGQKAEPQRDLPSPGMLRQLEPPGMNTKRLWQAALALEVRYFCNLNLLFHCLSWKCDVKISYRFSVTNEKVFWQIWGHVLFYVSGGWPLSWLRVILILVFALLQKILKVSDCQ